MFDGAFLCIEQENGGKKNSQGFDSNCAAPESLPPQRQLVCGMLTYSTSGLLPLDPDADPDLNSTVDSPLHCRLSLSLSLSAHRIDLARTCVYVCMYIRS